MAVALALAVIVAAVAAGTSGASQSKQSGGTLKGAGSSFVAPLVAQWQQNYKTAEIQYNPIGSGGGIAAITARNVDFGASDAPLSKDQFAACNGCVQIPWALSATSIPYNLDLNGRLHLNARVLADIYLGKITTWNDKRVRALNKKLNLPAQKITPVYRSDNSGTSWNFTDYLSSASKEWKSRVGVGVNANWPAGIGAPKSNGVAAAVSQTKGAIGYVDVAYALKNHLPFALIQNKAGKYVSPGIRAITAAAKTIKRVPASNELSIVNPARSQRLAYPICTFTYVIAPLNSSKAADLRAFVFWALTKGQTFGPKLLFVPIPKPVLAAAEKTLKRVHA
jgi:phosphate transport system substrate-binding protein